MSTVQPTGLDSFVCLFVPQIAVQSTFCYLSIDACRAARQLAHHLTSSKSGSAPLDSSCTNSTRHHLLARVAEHEARRNGTVQDTECHIEGGEHEVELRSCAAVHGEGGREKLSTGDVEDCDAHLDEVRPSTRHASVAQRQADAQHDTGREA